MAPRVKSVLVLLKTPDAVEVFKVNEVVPLEATVETGAVRTFKRHKETETYDGKILAGPDWQCKLQKYLVTPDGEIHQKKVAGQRYLGTSRQETALIKKNQASARELVLNQLDESIHQTGPPAPPVAQRTVSRLPKKRTIEHIDSLTEKLKHLPCLTERDDPDGSIVRVLLFPPMEKMKPVYITKLAKAIAIMSHSQDPTEMFKYILNCLIPDEILQDDALSWSGIADTVQLPQDLVTAAAGFATANAKGPAFNLKCTVTNFLYTCSHPELRPKRPKGVPSVPVRESPASPLREADHEDGQPEAAAPAPQPGPSTSSAPPATISGVGVTDFDIVDQTDVAPIQPILQLMPVTTSLISFAPLTPLTPFTPFTPPSPFGTEQSATVVPFGKY